MYFCKQNVASKFTSDDIVHIQLKWMDACNIIEKVSVAVKYYLLQSFKDLKL